MRAIFKIFSVVILTVLCLTSCKLEYRTRTLPEHIDSIYIPMAESKAYEYGLQEKLTNCLTEEFLADGRLDAVQENRADAKLLVTIDTWSTSASEFDSDDFPYTTEIRSTATIKLIESGKEKPMLEIKGIVSEGSYVSDSRRIDYKNPEEAKEESMRRLASAIVINVLTSDENTTATSEKEENKD